METKKKVLVVEDNPVISTKIKKVLEVYGFEIQDIIEEGNEAIRSIKENVPDIVLMDIILAGRMDGVETAKIITSQYNIPVIFLSSLDDLDTMERIKSSHAYSYIKKPFHDRELCVTVDMAISKHELEVELTKSQLWLKTTMNNMNEGLISIRPNRTIQFINIKGLELTLWEARDIQDKNISDVFLLRSIDSDEYINMTNLLDNVNKQKAIRNTYYLVRHNQTEIPVDLSVAVIKQDNISRGYVIVYQDISERKKSEEEREKLIIQLKDTIDELEQAQIKISKTQKELLESEKKNMVLAMAVTANHEINQPLMIIRGNIDLLEAKANELDDGIFNKYIEKINKGITRIEGILNKFKKLEDPKFISYANLTQMIDLHDDEE